MEIYNSPLRFIPATLLGVTERTDDIGRALAQLPGASLVGVIDSPITGTDGNREFLLGLTRKTNTDSPEAI